MQLTKALVSRPGSKDRQFKSDPVRLWAVTLVVLASAAACRESSDPVEPDPPPDPRGRYALTFWAGSLPTPGDFSKVADTIAVTGERDSGTLVERLWLRLPPTDSLVFAEVTGSYSQSLRLTLLYDCQGPGISLFCLLVPQTGEVADLVGDELRVFAPFGGVLRRYRRLSE